MTLPERELNVLSYNVNECQKHSFVCYAYWAFEGIIQLKFKIPSYPLLTLMSFKICISFTKIPFDHQLLQEIYFEKISLVLCSIQ